MDELHTVIQSISGETKAKPAHLTVFREFLAHLEKIQHKAPRARARVVAKPAKRKTRRVK
ncbi:hypothetical protein AFIC_002084 [[Pseudomonas] carboxydohydrogena]|uniref:Uncharacterized protein n=1 Tax=Afipia carboxydohydrogena TaxID=290 RepID=A0ABY8BKN2_AFICR|nr:hypothetical protein [[Pseudomonas] carboxydohydrogena]WEF50540.1 hypothetical protein AFIC_002084 [[Pseudomonas] carboxydohydrogena]